MRGTGHYITFFFVFWFPKLKLFNLSLRNMYSVYSATRIDIITMKHFIILREKNNKIYKKNCIYSVNI